MTSRVFLFLSLAFSASAFAAPADCVIADTKMVLTADFVVSCPGDFVLPDNAEVITHEHKFVVYTTGKVKFGSTDKPATTRCLDEDDTYDMQGKDCGGVEVIASTLDGANRTDVSAPGTASGTVLIQTASYTKNYRQQLKTGPGGAAKFYNNNAEVETNVRWTN